jgi:hypothetical protein
MNSPIIIKICEKCKKPFEIHIVAASANDVCASCKQRPVRTYKKLKPDVVISKPKEQEISIPIPSRKRSLAERYKGIDRIAKTIPRYHEYGD